LEAGLDRSSDPAFFFVLAFVLSVLVAGFTVSQLF
jgi:hypothetical protein